MVYKSLSTEIQLYSSELIHRFRGDYNREVHQAMKDSSPSDIISKVAPQEFLFNYRNLLNLTLIQLLDVGRMHRFFIEMSKMKKTEGSDYF